RTSYQEISFLLTFEEAPGRLAFQNRCGSSASRSDVVPQP
ncbi:hypothetical protein AVEN_11062-1, partial [Araneus ventricosus]